MVMKDIAARPVDKANVRVKVGLPVKFIGFAGMQQHVGETGDRDFALNRIAPLGQTRAGIINMAIYRMVEHGVTIDGLRKE